VPAASREARWIGPGLADRVRQGGSSCVGGQLPGSRRSAGGVSSIVQVREIHRGTTPLGDPEPAAATKQSQSPVQPRAGQCSVHGCTDGWTPGVGTAAHIGSRIGTTASPHAPLGPDHGLPTRPGVTGAMLGSAGDGGGFLLLCGRVSLGIGCDREAYLLAANVNPRRGLGVNSRARSCFDSSR